MLGQSRPGLAPRAGAQGADSGSGSSLLPSCVRRSRPCHVSPAGRVGHSSPAPPLVGSPTEGTPPSPRLRNVRGAHGDHRGAENLRAPPRPAGAQAGPPPPHTDAPHGNGEGPARTGQPRSHHAARSRHTPSACPVAPLVPGRSALSKRVGASERRRPEGCSPLGSGVPQDSWLVLTSTGVVAAPTCTGVQAAVSTPPGTLHVWPEAGTGPAAPRPRPGLQPPPRPPPPPSTPGVPAPPPRPAPGAALRQKLLVQLSLTAPSVHCDSGTGEPGAPSHAALLQGCVHACAPALKLVTSHLGHGLWGPGARGGGGGAARLHPHQLTAR